MGVVGPRKKDGAGSGVDAAKPPVKPGPRMPVLGIWVGTARRSGSRVRTGTAALRPDAPPDTMPRFETGRRERLI